MSDKQASFQAKYPHQYAFPTAKNPTTIAIMAAAAIIHNKPSGKHARGLFQAS